MGKVTEYTFARAMARRIEDSAKRLNHDVYKVVDEG